VSRHLEVLRSGPLSTVQDLGRFGHRSEGVSPSGAADLGASARANRLVGNMPGAAVLEVTFGHAVLRAADALTVAITGAVCPAVPMDAAVELAAGDTLELPAASTGLRIYIAVAGGIAVPAILGSRSTDTLSGLGPAPLRDGDILPVGDAAGDHGGDHAGLPLRSAATVSAQPIPLAVLRGPRDDWLPAAGWSALVEQAWRVSPDSNRVAVRLLGTALPVRTASLEPEPLVRGAIQLPPDGMPIAFLADHPVTGGYPVVGVLTAASSDAIAQCRPGAMVRLRA
jgi:biotin-dependent carboxylase-like uncharacterized protein